jgi:hypothetical protein
MGKKKAEFIEGLDQLIQQAILEGKQELEITAGALHKHVGDYPPEPGTDHAMATASDVLREAVAKHHGKIIYSPPKGKGARFEVSLPLS